MSALVGQTGYFHVIAIDYDGTVAERDRTHPEAIAALGGLRENGRRVVSVTGRILADPPAVFPDVDQHFDSIVAENGAVLTRHGTTRTLAAPVPRDLDNALGARGIRSRRGVVFLACEGRDDAAVLAEVRNQHLECQLIR